MASKDRTSAILAEVIAEAKALPRFLMPIEIFSRSRALADLPPSLMLTQELVALAEYKPNPHARRVAMIAIRFRGDFSDPRTVEVLVRALRDRAEWVRYDAAQALECSRIATPQILDGLRVLAKGAIEDPPLSDEAGQAKKAALDALRSLENPAQVREAAKPEVWVDPKFAEQMRKQGLMK